MTVVDPHVQPVVAGLPRDCTFDAGDFAIIAATGTPSRCPAR
jgi:hypothetical protein